MNKLTIPTILSLTVLVAGIFAFMPVEQASTVHLSNTVTLATGGIGVGDFATGAITAAAIADDSEPFSLSVTTVDLDTTTAPTCTSDKPFILEVNAHGATGTTLTVSDGANDFVFTFTTADPNRNFTLAGEANQVWTLTGSVASVQVVTAIRTQQGATAECLAA